MTIIRKIGIKQTAPNINVWRVTYDGKVLGDSRGHSKEGAISEAKAICTLAGDGCWVGARWETVTNVLDIEGA